MKVLIFLLVFGLAHGLSFSRSLETEGTLGFASMTFLNGLLSELAAREGAEWARLQWAWGWDLSFWPWPFLGLGLESLASTGKILGREERTLSVAALGLQGKLVLDFVFLGQDLQMKAGVGGLWAWTAGLLEASGLGWSGAAGLWWRVFQFWSLGLTVGLGYRWAWVPVLRTPREELRPRTGPALDFSGPFGGVRVRWTW